MNPPLGTPLPDYPGGIPLSNMVPLPEKLGSGFCIGALEAFRSVDYRAFATSDNEVAVQTFYLKAFYGGDSPWGLKGNGTWITQTSETECFSNEIGGGPLLARDVSANMIYLIKNSTEADLIKEYFPQTPTGLNVVVVIRGFKKRTLG